jgi:hypothetical protein
MNHRSFVRWLQTMFAVELHPVSDPANTPRGPAGTALYSWTLTRSSSKRSFARHFRKIRICAITLFTLMFRSAATWPGGKRCSNAQRKSSKFRPMAADDVRSGAAPRRQTTVRLDDMDDLGRRRTSGRQSTAPRGGRSPGVTSLYGITG